MRYVLKFLQFIPEKVMAEIKRNLVEEEDEPSNVAAAFYLELEESDNADIVKEKAEKMCKEMRQDAVKIFRELE